MRRSMPNTLLTPVVCLVLCGVVPPACGDGLVRPPKVYQGQPYSGSIAERSQEAIIIFEPGDEEREAREDLILKIAVEGEVDQFAWIVPLPNEPEVAKENPQLFPEIFVYVEARLEQLSKRDGAKAAGAADATPQAEPEAVDVVSRKTVGAYDVAIVRENRAGALAEWLRQEEFHALPDDSEDVMRFYREKDYIFACIKVSEAELATGETVVLHPLRFTFTTGGRDAIYFPMKLTGLQDVPFDVNLYVFHRAWLNDHLNQYGYEHRGFDRRYRDWDTPACEPNAGKAYSAPEHDPFLKNMAWRLPRVTALMQKLHPGRRYYLTNIQAENLQPADVRDWPDDLWLFSYYTDKDFIPYDARPGGVAAAAWPGANGGSSNEQGRLAVAWASPALLVAMLGLLILVLGILGILVMIVFRRIARQ